MNLNVIKPNYTVRMNKYVAFHKVVRVRRDLMRNTIDSDDNKEQRVDDILV